MFRISGPDRTTHRLREAPTGPALPVGPPAPEQIKEILKSQTYEELTTELDVRERILWYFMSPVSRLTATGGLMHDISG
jgi:hypothetical protein